MKQTTHLRFQGKARAAVLALSCALALGVSGHASANLTGPANAPNMAQLTSGPGISTGKTYYVATNGNDNNDGLTLNTPFATPEKAIGLVQPGDTIEIRGGTYRPTAGDSGMYVRHGGNPNAWIKIEAYNHEPVVIDCTGMDFGFFFFQEAPYWIMSGLEVVGGNDYTVKIDAPNTRIVGNNLHGAHDDIVKVVPSASNAVIYGNEIHHNIPDPTQQYPNAQGVDIVAANNVWVAYNFIHDTASIGVYAKGGAHAPVFENNFLENINSRGLMLGQQTDPAFMNPGPYESYDGIIRNNVVINSQDACLAVASSYNAHVYNNSCVNAAISSQGAIYISNEANTGQANTNVDIEDNIVMVSGTSNRPVVKIGPNAMTDPATLHMDRNLYWSPNGPGAITFLWEDKQLYNIPMSDWQAVTGMEKTSIIADPQYTIDGPLTISPTSPAIDAGIPTPATIDFDNHPRPQGAAVDIGAYEVR